MLKNKSQVVSKLKITYCKRTINVSQNGSWVLALVSASFPGKGLGLLLTVKALFQIEILEDSTHFTSITINNGYGNATSPCLQYYWVDCSRWTGVVELQLRMTSSTYI